MRWDAPRAMVLCFELINTFTSSYWSSAFRLIFGSRAIGIQIILDDTSLGIVRFLRRMFASDIKTAIFSVVIVASCSQRHCATPAFPLLEFTHEVRSCIQGHISGD